MPPLLGEMLAKVVSLQQHLQRPPRMISNCFCTANLDFDSIPIREIEKYIYPLKNSAGKNAHAKP